MTEKNKMSDVTKAVINAMNITQEELTTGIEKLSELYEFKTLEKSLKGYLNEREKNEIAKLTYDFAIKEFLPGIFSDDKAVKEKWFNFYTNLIGGPTSYAIVIDEDGNKLFSLPPILESTDMFLRLRNGSVMSISMGMLEALNKKDNNPVLYNNYMKAIEKQIGKNYAGVMQENLNKWNEIKEKYYLPTLDGKVRDEDPNNNEEPMLTDLIELEEEEVVFTGSVKDIIIEL